MVWIERMEQVFPSLRLKSNVRQTIQYASSLKADCQAMPVIMQAQHFLENHPFMCLFLVILVVLGFLPFLVFLAFVLGSFLSISFCAPNTGPLLQSSLQPNYEPFLAKSFSRIMLNRVILQIYESTQIFAKIPNL